MKTSRSFLMRFHCTYFGYTNITHPAEWHSWPWESEHINMNKNLIIHTLVLKGWNKILTSHLNKSWIRPYFSGASTQSSTWLCDPEWNTDKRLVCQTPRAFVWMFHAYSGRLLKNVCLGRLSWPTFVFALSCMYWSPLTHSRTSKPSRSMTLAWALPATTRMLSPVALYSTERIGWLETWPMFRYWTDMIAASKTKFLILLQRQRY